jgi:hypothetical protein
MLWCKEKGTHHVACGTLILDKETRQVSCRVDTGHVACGTLIVEKETKQVACRRTERHRRETQHVESRSHSRHVTLDTASQESFTACQESFSRSPHPPCSSGRVCAGALLSTWHHTCCEIWHAAASGSTNMASSSVTGAGTRWMLTMGTIAYSANAPSAPDSGFRVQRLGRRD